GGWALWALSSALAGAPTGVDAPRDAPAHRAPERANSATFDPTGGDGAPARRRVVDPESAVPDGETAAEPAADGRASPVAVGDPAMHVEELLAEFERLARSSALRERHIRDPRALLAHLAQTW